MTPDEEEEKNEAGATPPETPAEEPAAPEEPPIIATYTPPDSEPPPLGHDSIIDLSSQRFSPPPPLDNAEPEAQPEEDRPRPPVFSSRPREDETPPPEAIGEPEPAPEPEIVRPPVFASRPAEEAPPPPSDSLYTPVSAEPEPPLHEEYAEPERYAPPQEEPREAYADFGEPEIPMPPPSRRGDKKRARDARRNLDLDLGRIKRRKRYGLFITIVSVLFVALILAPVTWVGAYLFFDPPATVLMLQRAAEGQTIHHTAIPITRMSPHIVRAVIAAEDGNFCTHDGFDVEAIRNAMEANEDGGRVRGGSTISQQTAKNLFLWPERSWVRKGLETYFTALMEFIWPKRRIMEAYLNAAEWGDGNFGIEAAARARFGVSAADLTPLQAARLAAVLPSPNRWRADNPGPYVRRRAATIVQRAQVVRNEHMASCVLALDRVR